jgi:hypothetical protein
MKMISGFECIADSSVGNEYGHVPGHQYHDVEVGIGQRGQTFRVVILETWGSAQGYDEEHGRNKVVARGTDWQDALREAVGRAQSVGIDAKYMVQAVSEAEDAMHEAMAQTVDA